MRNNDLIRFLGLSLLGVMITVMAWGATAYFTHRKHLDSGMGCTDCHTGIPESSLARDNNMPRPEICKACHESPPEVKFRASDDREVIFSHEIHLAASIACTTCHYLGGQGVDARMHLPRMAVCLSCHDDMGKTEECKDCHTKLGSPELVPESHNAQWLFAHGGQGALDQAYCSNCHQQSFCQECHQGDNIKPRPHRRNWIYVHSLGARKGLLECTDCHEVANESKCVTCHRSPEGRPSSHRRRSWITRHRDEARVDPAACATCHFDVEGDPVCGGCHESD